MKSQCRQLNSNNGKESEAGYVSGEIAFSGIKWCQLVGDEEEEEEIIVNEETASEKEYGETNFWDSFEGIEFDNEDPDELNDVTFALWENDILNNREESSDKVEGAMPSLSTTAYEERRQNKTKRQRNETKRRNQQHIGRSTSSTRCLDIEERMP